MPTFSLPLGFLVCLLLAGCGNTRAVVDQFARAVVKSEAKLEEAEQLAADAHSKYVAATAAFSAGQGSEAAALSALVTFRLLRDNADRLKAVAERDKEKWAAASAKDAAEQAAAAAKASREHLRWLLLVFGYAALVLAAVCGVILWWLNMHRITAVVSLALSVAGGSCLFLAYTWEWLPYAVGGGGILVVIVLGCLFVRKIRMAQELNNDHTRRAARAIPSPEAQAAVKAESARKAMALGLVQASAFLRGKAVSGAEMRAIVAAKSSPLTFNDTPDAPGHATDSPA